MICHEISSKSSLIYDIFKENNCFTAFTLHDFSMLSNAWLTPGGPPFCLGSEDHPLKIASSFPLATFFAPSITKQILIPRNSITSQKQPRGYETIPLDDASDLHSKLYFYL